MELVGQPVVLHRSDRQARYYESGEHLVRWRGGTEMSRYDCRLLLAEGDDCGTVGCSTVWDEDEGIAEELRRFRYGDLPVEDGGEGWVDEEDGRRRRRDQALREKAASGKYSAVAHDYAKDMAAAAPPAARAGEDESGGVDDAFRCGFAVPAGLAVPSSRRQHEAIVRAAERLRGRAQNAPLLRLREQGNPLYDFLDEAHRLHGYFVLLRDEQPHQGPGEGGGDALSLLQGYESGGSSSSEAPEDAGSDSRQAARMAKAVALRAHFERLTKGEPGQAGSRASKRRRTAAEEEEEGEERVGT